MGCYDDHDDLMINRFAGDSLVAGAIQQDKADPKQNPVFFSSALCLMSDLMRCSIGKCGGGGGVYAIKDITLRSI